MGDRLLSVVVAVLAVVAVLVSWKAYVSWFDVSPFLLPPPEDVARATAALVAEGETWRHARVTATEIVGGFSLALVFGVVTGLLVAEIRMVERALSPLLVALQVVPKVTVIPLFLLWFGFGPASKLVIAAVFAYFPITTGTVAGLRSVDLHHRDLAAVLQARWYQRILLIDLPGALPSVLTGMEVAIVLATIGAVVAEYLAGSEGLGWMALRALNQVRVAELFGVVVLLSALGYAFYLAITVLRRLVVPWHASVRRLVAG